MIAGARTTSEVEHLESNPLERCRLPTPGRVSCPGLSSVSTRLLSPQPQEHTIEMLQLDPTMGILSSLKQNETARSSGDSHIMSISSTDTISSEYPINDPHRLQFKRRSGHSPSFTKPLQPVNMTEVFMMGYAQITGSFTIDGSLMKQQPFEHVKRKCIVGGQSGGGIIRAKKREQQNRLFNNLIWGSLGDSITEILGGGDLDQAHMSKEKASLPSIPILSTPQSVLFVDLRIEPGQSITYNYRCPLPNVLPPTHKGRAIKVNYHLTIGIQRAANSALKQQISTVDVPFRVITGTAGETSLQTLRTKLTRQRKGQVLFPRPYDPPCHTC